MADALYCWRCDAIVPMLNEQEWAVISPLLANAIQQLKLYREQNQCPLAEAKERGLEFQALAKFEEITGFKETNVDAISHHRASIYGPTYPACGKPLRTPRASYCASCGRTRA